MTDPRPSLAQQIEAVEWAEVQAREIARRGKERNGRRMELCLAAAAETLRTLEFGSAIAR